MVISAVRSLLGNKLMISARVIALAVQFTMTRDAAAQSVTDQLGPLTDRQRGEVALPLSVRSRNPCREGWRLCTVILADERGH